MQTFDYAKALTVTDGDEGLLKELINLFHEQSSRLLSEMSRAIDGSQADQLQRAAHTLKGAAGNVGAMTLCEVALSLETMGANNDFETVKASFEKLTAEIKKFEQETAKYQEMSG